MPRSVSLKAVTVRFPKHLVDEMKVLGDARSMTLAETVRYIIEDHFDEEPRRQQTRKSLNRMMEIIEYLLATSFEQNKALPPERRKQMLVEVGEAIQRYHPLL